MPSSKTIYEKERNELVELLRDCTGWENGLATNEMSKAIFNSSDRESMKKLRSVLRVTRKYFLEEDPRRLCLHWRAKGIGDKGQKELIYRWFLARDNEDVDYVKGKFVLHITKDTYLYVITAPALDKFLTESQKKELKSGLGKAIEQLTNMEIKKLEEGKGNNENQDK